MRHAILMVTLVTALFSMLGAGAPVYAQPYPGKDMAPKGRPMGPAKQEEMERMRDARMRDAQGPARPVHERMSPEDRRQLRRDIDQHGRELYRGRNR